MAAYKRLIDQEVVEDKSRNFVIGNRESLTMHESFEDVSQVGTSIPEILRGRESQTRRNAILALRYVDVRRAIPVLQKAIQDSDEQVRLLAQTHFNRIMAELEVGIKTIETELQSQPRTPTRLIKLSELYHELVFLGLSSEESKRIYLERCVELLEEARLLTPDDLNISVNLMRCNVKLGKTAKARAQLEFLRSQNYRRELLSPWESDLFFQDCDWSALVESLRALRPPPGRMTVLDDQIKLWVGQNPRARGKNRASASQDRKINQLLGATSMIRRQTTSNIPSSKAQSPDGSVAEPPSSQA